jgi:hypothetical protein
MNINATGTAGSIEQFLKLAEIARTRNAGFSTPVRPPARPARAVPAPAAQAAAGPRGAYAIAANPDTIYGVAGEETGRNGTPAVGTRFDAYA